MVNLENLRILEKQRKFKNFINLRFCEVNKCQRWRGIGGKKKGRKIKDGEG